VKRILLTPFKILFDFIFPPYCPITSVKLKDNESLYSNSVLFKLEISGNPVQIRDIKLNNLIKDDIYFDNLYSLFASFSESQEIIYAGQNRQDNSINEENNTYERIDDDDDDIINQELTAGEIERINATVLNNVV